jgi:hypothetical protein
LNWGIYFTARLKELAFVLTSDNRERFNTSAVTPVSQLPASPISKNLHIFYDKLKIKARTNNILEHSGH